MTFDEFYAAQYGAITAQLYAYFGDRHEAQDVAQEAFCRALSRWKSVSEFDDPVSWVRRVAWNLALSRWRRARTALTFLRKQPPREPRAEPPNEDRLALMSALAVLPPPQRRAVVLHYLADLTIADIADREGVAVGTVKSWLHRARTSLAVQLGPAEEVRHA